jgi:hypothetical protein
LSVFRFLLKIKWGQRILNNLQFPEFFKQRPPYAKLNMLDLVIKRLAITRFSMQQELNSIYSHIMVVLQGISIQFDTSISKSTKINEIIENHSSFLATIYRKSFLNSKSKKTRGIIVEILKLSKIVFDEWHNVCTFYALDSTGKIGDSLSLAKINVNTIEIEKALVACQNQLKDVFDH